MDAQYLSSNAEIKETKNANNQNEPIYLQIDGERVLAERVSMEQLNQLVDDALARSKETIAQIAKFDN